MSKLTEEAERKWKAYDAFARELKKVAGEFTWKVDQFGQIRGTHPDWVHDLCPVTAVDYAKTRAFRRLREVHEVIDSIGLGQYGVEMVMAIDTDRSGRLRDLLLETVGLK